MWHVLGRRDIDTGFCCSDMKEREDLGGVGGSMKEQDGREWRGFSCLRIGTRGELL